MNNKLNGIRNNRLNGIKNKNESLEILVEASGHGKPEEIPRRRILRSQNASH